MSIPSIPNLYTVNKNVWINKNLKKEHNSRFIEIA